jgi:hypothetical protein
MLVAGWMRRCILAMSSATFSRSPQHVGVKAFCRDAPRCLRKNINTRLTCIFETATIPSLEASMKAPSIGLPRRKKLRAAPAAKPTRPDRAKRTWPLAQRAALASCYAMACPTQDRSAGLSPVDGQHCRRNSPMHPPLAAPNLRRLDLLGRGLKAGRLAQRDPSQSMCRASCGPTQHRPRCG